MATLNPESEGQKRSGCCACTCAAQNHAFDARNETSLCSPSNVYGVNSKARLDASFVHISHDRLAVPDKDMIFQKYSIDQGLLGSERLTSVLIDASLEGSNSNVLVGSGLNASLCRSCIEKVAQALDADTERLLAEANVYAGTMTAEEDKELGMKKALVINIGIERNTDFSPDQLGGQLFYDAIASFQEESQVLKSACIDHENELKFLNEMLVNQMHRTLVLEEAEDALCSDVNDLEIAARDFEHACHRLSSKCSEAQQEVEKLSRVQLHHLGMGEVVVYGCDRKYPVINSLRLGFCPKGSLGWDEISAAWAQAAQLIIIVGGAVKFSSQDLRIVPITSCAKIIEYGDRRIVHNLGQDSDRSFHCEHSASRSGPHSTERVNMQFALCAFNALLHQLFCHIHQLCPGKRQEEPFIMTRHKIGMHDLLKLGKEDDAGWSAAITCIASNLQWLSENVLCHVQHGLAKSS